MIIIQAKQQQGFWRCGVFHSFDPTDHDDTAFTADQLVILQAEPMLSVTVEKAKPTKKTDAE
jgi:uncharacterized membrane protein